MTASVQTRRFFHACIKTTDTPTQSAMQCGYTLRSCFGAPQAADNLNYTQAARARMQQMFDAAKKLKAGV